jgi:hypothetical protein
LEDELDTTYFSGLAEEAVEEGGEDASIDALLNKELAKGGNDRDETSLSNIFSHKDRKKGKVVETENADLTQAKEAEGTENLKLKFNSSYTRFEFAAFTYKHEDLAGVGLNDLLRDLTSTPRGSPRLAESAPASPRGDHTPDDGGKIPKSPKPASPNIVRSPSDPDQRRGKVSRTPSLEPPQAGSSQPSVPHSESSPTIAVSVGKKHRRTPSSPNTALPPTSPRNHDSPPPESPTSESSGPFSKIKKRLSALRSIWKKDDDSGSAPNSPGASPERRVRILDKHATLTTYLCVETTRDRLALPAIQLLPLADVLEQSTSTRLLMYATLSCSRSRKGPTNEYRRAAEIERLRPLILAAHRV